MRQRRPASSTTRWMPGIDLQPASWNGAGTKSWKKSRQSSNGFPVSMPSATRYRLKRKSACVRWATHFAGVWQSDHCPPTLKKMIFRTAIEDIIVLTDQGKKTLEL